MNAGWRQRFIERTASKPSGEWAVRRYNEPVAHYRSFRTILEMLNLKQEDEYFEMGCGGGVLLRQALEQVSFAAGIDHSRDMVELSRKNNADAIASGRAEILEGNVAALPWPDGRFSAGASANMFFFVPEPQKALSDACRVRRPGGRFALITLGDSLPGKVIFGWLYKLRLYSDARMEKMLKEAGFSRVEVHTRRFFYQICHAVK